jgi:hypothetical protein
MLDGFARRTEAILVELRTSVEALFRHAGDVLVSSTDAFGKGLEAFRADWRAFWEEASRNTATTVHDIERAAHAASGAATALTAVLNDAQANLGSSLERIAHESAALATSLTNLGGQTEILVAEMKSELRDFNETNKRELHSFVQEWRQKLELVSQQHASALKDHIDNLEARYTQLQDGWITRQAGAIHSFADTLRDSAADLVAQWRNGWRDTEQALKAVQAHSEASDKALHELFSDLQKLLNQLVAATKTTDLVQEANRHVAGVRTDLQELRTTVADTLAEQLRTLRMMESRVPVPTSSPDGTAEAAREATHQVASMNANVRELQAGVLDGLAEQLRALRRIESILIESQHDIKDRGAEPVKGKPPVSYRPPGFWSKLFTRRR